MITMLTSADISATQYIKSPLLFLSILLILFETYTLASFNMYCMQPFGRADVQQDSVCSGIMKVSPFILFLRLLDLAQYC